jgi:hypothetical protein
VKARFPSVCPECSKGISIGEEIQWKAFHKDHQRDEDAAGGRDGGQLAERLGFQPHDSAVCFEWSVFLLPRAVGEPTARVEAETRWQRDTVRTLFESVDSEE